METLKIIKKPGPGKRLKVCAYARISNINRESSINEQIDYYTSLIFNNRDWEFAGIYADEGISGTTTEARKQFLLMIEKAKNGLIDVIIVKSISRFARNVMNLLVTIQELTSIGVEVFFEKEGISTMDPQSTVYLTCWAQFAEEEIKSMSANKKWRDEKNFRDGIYHINPNQMLGFRLNDKKEVEIYEPEAKWIREIFKMYVLGEKPASIAEWLTENSVKTGKGNSKWSSSSVRNILRNEKYCGDCIMNKRYTVDPMTHQTKKNNGERELYIVRDGHPAIVTREIFEEVQKILDRNKNHFKITSKTHQKIESEYTHFIYCPYCGRFYFSKKIRHTELLKPTIKSMFYCSSNRTRQMCKESESVYQEDLKVIIAKQIHILKSNEKAFKEAVIDAYRKDRSPIIEEQIKKLSDEIFNLRESLKLIVDRNEESIRLLCENYKYEIKKKTQKRLELENELLTQINPIEKAEQIVKALREMPNQDTADELKFRKLFCHVIAYSRDKLLFIIGNDNLKNIPKNPPLLFKGEHSYKIRCTTYKTEFGIYINK
ncbi:MAG: recombinase family protein [Bacilli bacterium]